MMPISSCSSRASACGWLHFAAGELPHPRLVGVGRTLRQQNLAILFNNGGDNINHF
jgi:hypothetical protein